MVFDRLLQNQQARGFVADANNQIAYQDFVQWFTLLDARFKAEKPQCIAVFAENTALLAVLLQYLLLRRINFYLASSKANNGCPAFCDTTITLTDAPITNMSVRWFGIEQNRQYRPLANAVAASVNGVAVLSTSGSTGTPKFIYFDQQKLLKNALNAAHRFAYDDAERILVTVPATHMFGLGVGLLPGLLAGVNIKLVNKSNIIKLLQAILGFKPNYTLITPALCRMLLLLKKNISSQSTYISAGEQLDTGTAQQFEQQIGQIINLYGSSELGAIATSADNTDNNNWAGALSPLPQVTVKTATAPKGELLCKSPYGFEFYIDAHGHKIPYEAQAWYPTKDLGQRLVGGQFNVLGRLDYCINRSGFLVSMEQIELGLKGLFQQINQVVAIAGQSQQVLAICELRNGAQNKAFELLNEAKKHLQRDLLPNDMLIVDELDKLKNGKPDRISIARKYSLQVEKQLSVNI